ncbi:MAG TPA: sulfurtransferase TusA family protein [Spirochaetota bacterium]|jgi:tRNA 2-thiouridine synthesizing protein A|nr:sulfurtransferase TusA family protein [Spirochaetota bacterium]OPZ34199.1 MAG: Sulfurtransferase TusA [Spirochaetes bacterium ADurb.BinA120]HNU93096.1 sulfurtransferase TusA family protein [Spirochaetota bacterium]HPI15615.1 sulfurtransferase TusA family protein [Spirochaetota bacterium]HPO46052.1 sulfurtransferase TusA family protein [Spirochaetota bacterium]
MSDEIKADVTMDLKGLACPLPVVKVSQQIKKMKVGQVLEAETTDPGAHADFPAWAKSSGNEILKTVKEEKSARFYIKKLK